MSPVETLGLALGAGFSSGLNLYATVATLGLLQRFGVLHLPPGLQIVSHPWVLGISISLYLLEFLADKIPYFDTFWDATHTFIRPPAAALLAFAAAGAAHRNGVGAPRCSPAESLSHLMAQKPARAPPSTPAPNRSA